MPNALRKLRKMLKKVSFIYKGRRFHITARKCGMFSRFLGLMFSPREKSETLLFEFQKPVNLSIHSFFVFFPFIAVWVDENGKIAEIKKVKPFTLSVRTKKSWKKLLEIPVNKKNYEKVKLLVGD